MSGMVALMVISPKIRITMYTCTDYRKMKFFFGMRTSNSLSTSGNFKHILFLMSEQRLRFISRIYKDIIKKHTHYIIEKSYAHCRPKETVACTLESPFTCFDFFHLLPKHALGWRNIPHQSACQSTQRFQFYRTLQNGEKTENSAEIRGKLALAPKPLASKIYYLGWIKRYSALVKVFGHLQRLLV